jgi:hypothetical protein
MSMNSKLSPGSTNNTPTSQDHSASQELSDSRGILSRRRSQHSVLGSLDARRGAPRCSGRFWFRKILFVSTRRAAQKGFVQKGFVQKVLFRRFCWVLRRSARRCGA